MIGKKRSAPCPVAGCEAKWTRETVEKDNSFKLRLDRFFRIQQTHATDQHDAVDIEDDGYEAI